MRQYRSFGSEALASPYALHDSTAEAVIPMDCCSFNVFGFIEYFIIGVYLYSLVVYHSRMDKKHLYAVPEPSDQEKEQYALSLVQAGTDAFMSDDPVVRKKGLAQVEKILNPPKPSLTVIPSKK